MHVRRSLLTGMKPRLAVWPSFSRVSPWWLAGAVAAVHLVFARASVAVPYVFGDEAGYLTKAAALAGVTTDAYSSYYPGYALVLAPLYAIAPHTLAIYPWVHLVNALLAGGAAWLLLAIAGILAPARSAATRWVAAGTVACYAPSLAYSAFALSENLFIPIVLSLGWLLLREVERGERARRILIMLAAVGLMLTHPKGVLVVAAFGLGWLAGVWRRGWVERLRVVGWLGGALVVFVPLQILAEAFFRHRMGYYSDGVSGHYPGASALLGMLVDALSLDSLEAMAAQVAGQLFYLGVASLGLALLGLASRRAEGSEAVRAYDVFARASLVLTLLMTAFFMRHGGRVDALFYGRYDEGVLGLVLLPALLKPAPKRHWWWAALAIAALGWILVVVHGARLQGQVVELNLFGLQLWRFLGAVSSRQLVLPLLAVPGAAAVALVGMLARSSWLGGVIGALFLLAALQGSAGYLRPESHTNSQRHRIADLIHRDFSAVTCVDYDIRAGEYWQRYNSQVLLLPVRMHETAVSPLAPGQVDDGRTHARCSDLVISTAPHLDSLYPRARLLEREEGSTEALWWVPRASHGN